MRHQAAVPIWSVVICSVVILVVGCGGGGPQMMTPTPTPAISVTITPAGENLQSGQQTDFIAEVVGTADQGVTWSVVENNGGSISSTGSYTAPSIEGVFHIRAASTAAPAASDTITITVGTPFPPASLMWSVWGSGPSDVWATGDTVAYHWDGTKWHSTFMNSKYGPFVDSVSAVWGTGPNDVWQSGTSVAIEFKHWNGITWSDVPPNLVAFATGLWGSGSNDIWAFGATASTVLFHWDGSAWNFEPIQPSQGQAFWFQSGWGSAANDVWAVGGGDDMGHTLRSATVFHWDGSTWSQVISGLNAPLLGIWGSAANDVWTVGEKGLIAHWDGTAWTPVASGTTQDLWSVWGFATNDVWVVGAAGTVLHWNGTAWIPVATTNTHDLHAVWGSSPTNLWAVGDRVILHLP